MLDRKEKLYNQASVSSIKNDTLSDKSEIDEIENDVNLGAIGGAGIRQKPTLMVARLCLMVTIF